MHIREDGVRAYIQRFHGTLDLVSQRFFRSDQAKDLLHRSLLPAKVICYVSTQFGVAFEYSKAATTSIETVRGSARIEDLVVKAPKRLRNIGPMFNIGGSHIMIASLTLADGFPFRLSDEQANVTFRDVRFSCDALRWVRNVEYVEVYGDRRAERWTLAQAESRAKDEVLSALFLAQRAKTNEISLHEYVSSFREKTVLVLGSYYNDAGRQRLTAIVRILEDLGYEPLLIKDVPDFEHYDLPQKVTAIGVMSRFVVVDDSEPSGHLAEVEICRHNRWVTVLLRAGHGASWMTAGASYSSNVILEKEYVPENERPAVSESVQWAEARLDEMKGKLNRLYPWRIES